MCQPKNRRINIRDQSRILLPRLILDPRLRSARLSSKMHCVIDGEGGEENVVFRAVLDVSAVVGSDLRWCEGVVVDVAVYGVIFGPAICESFEKSCAT
jgi:hypothetical protein